MVVEMVVQVARIEIRASLVNLIFLIEVDHAAAFVVQVFAFFLMFSDDISQDCSKRSTITHLSAICPSG